MGKYAKVINSLTKSQKKALLLFGETDNLYRYHDEFEKYQEPFLWSDTKFTIESAPDRTLFALSNKGLVIGEESKCAGWFWVLSDYGKEVLEYLENEMEEKAVEQKFLRDLIDFNNKGMVICGTRKHMKY